MKWYLTISVSAFLLLALAGCNGSGKGVEVIVDDDGQFPASLAGTWTSDRDGWQFVLESDGTISSAIVTLGRVKVEPGKVTKVPMLMDGEGIYEPGRWLVAYSPEQRMLTVTIALDRIYIELGKDLLEGSSRDVFVGQVSEDGSEWIAEWTTFTNYMAHTAEHPNADLSSDPVYGVTTTLTFVKSDKPQDG
jgi:hypothetical protein